MPTAVPIEELEDAQGVLEAGASLLAHSVRDAPVDDDLIRRMRARDVCLILAATASAAGIGALYEEVDVRCRVPPVEGACPPDQVAEEVRQRPYLVPGLLTAGAIGVAGAIHALTTARSDLSVSRTESGGVELRFPIRSDGSVLLGLDMEPVPPPLHGEALWAIGLRFLF